MMEGRWKEGFVYSLLTSIQFGCCLIWFQVHLISGSKVLLFLLFFWFQFHTLSIYIIRWKSIKRTSDIIGYHFFTFLLISVVWYVISFSPCVVISFSGGFLYKNTYFYKIWNQMKCGYLSVFASVCREYCRENGLVRLCRVGLVRCFGQFRCFPEI